MFRAVLRAMLWKSFPVHPPHASACWAAPQALALAGAARERFCSAWLAGLPHLAELKLEGYELAELAHLPRGLQVLDLSGCRVCYDNAVCLPLGVRPAVLAVPNGSGGHWRG